VEVYKKEKDVHNRRKETSVLDYYAPELKEKWIRKQPLVASL
jgi:hypothetical protein